MRRELANVLDELRDGLVDSAARAGLRLCAVEMALPMDFLLVLRGGGAVLLADLPRSRADDAWYDTRSQLRIRWQAVADGEAGT